MTEDEAKTKWCHATAYRTLYDAAARHPDNADANMNRCIASACMAWRTRHQWFDNAQQDPIWVSYAPYAFEPGVGQERDDGYCGLAGEIPQ